LSENKEFSAEHCERTVTVDLSREGCFVFSVRDWKPGDSAWFTIKELRDNTPICGLVRWCLKWGEGMRVPGIGLKFTEITESQAREIYDSLWLEN
jgi:Tfp pilus assembly protein PilZ